MLLNLCINFIIELVPRISLVCFSLSVGFSKQFSNFLDKYFNINIDLLIIQFPQMVLKAGVVFAPTLVIQIKKIIKLMILIISIKIIRDLKQIKLKIKIISLQSLRKIQTK